MHYEYFRWVASEKPRERLTEAVTRRVEMGFHCCRHSLEVSPSRLLIITANNPLSSAAIWMLMITRPLGHHKTCELWARKKTAACKRRQRGRKEAYLSLAGRDETTFETQICYSNLFTPPPAMKDRVPPRSPQSAPRPLPSHLAQESHPPQPQSSCQKGEKTDVGQHNAVRLERRSFQF